jgi:hypothetical protein
MNPHMAADTQGDQQIRPVSPVAMMNYQRRTFATATAATAVALQHALAQSAEKAQGMISPVITRTAAAEGFKRDALAARTQEGQLNCLPRPLHWVHQQLGFSAVHVQNGGFRHRPSR